jgi:hypothetical protein
LQSLRGNVMCLYRFWPGGKPCSPSALMSLSGVLVLYRRHAESNSSNPITMAPENIRVLTKSLSVWELAVSKPGTGTNALSGGKLNRFSPNGKNLAQSPVTQVDSRPDHDSQ